MPTSNVGPSVPPPSCTCPNERNDLLCPVHVHRGLQRSIMHNPIAVRLAWEMDLNWSALIGRDGAYDLFRQHARFPMWPVTGICLDPLWIRTREIAHPNGGGR